jgi:SAM-dependent methyltransferase
VANQVKEAYGVDISDQRNEEDQKNQPANFHYTTFDGYTLDLPDNLVDVFFSDQLIEHIHPDETQNHFEMVYRTLKPGGKYIFRIPHRLSGPHDISKHFTDTPTGFHLNEPTYREMAAMLKKVGFSDFQTFWNARTIAFRLPYIYFSTVEWIAEKIPHKIRRKPTRVLIPYLYMIGIK